MRAKPQPSKPNATAISLSWLRAFVSDERFPMAMAYVKRHKRHNSKSLQEQNHQQVFVAGYDAGFDDCISQIIEAAGGEENFSHGDLSSLEQVSNRTESY